MTLLLFNNTHAHLIYIYTLLHTSEKKEFRFERRRKNGSNKLENGPEHSVVDVKSEDNFARNIIKKKRTSAAVCQYNSLKFILPTADLVERFFIAAGYALNDLRERLLPAKFWDKKTVQAVINSK